MPDISNVDNRSAPLTSLQSAHAEAVTSRSVILLVSGVALGLIGAVASNYLLLCGPWSAQINQIVGFSLLGASLLLTVTAAIVWASKGCHAPLTKNLQESPSNEKSPYSSEGSSLEPTAKQPISSESPPQENASPGAEKKDEILNELPVEKSNFDVSSLSKDVLEAIFHFLPTISDLLTAGMVCRTWNETIDRGSLWNKYLPLCDRGNKLSQHKNRYKMFYTGDLYKLEPVLTLVDSNKSGKLSNFLSDFGSLFSINKEESQKEVRLQCRSKGEVVSKISNVINPGCEDYTRNTSLHQNTLAYLNSDGVVILRDLNTSDETRLEIPKALTGMDKDPSCLTTTNTGVYLGCRNGSIHVFSLKGVYKNTIAANCNGAIKKLYVDEERIVSFVGRDRPPSAAIRKVDKNIINIRSFKDQDENRSIIVSIFYDFMMCNQYGVLYENSNLKVGIYNFRTKSFKLITSASAHIDGMKFHVFQNSLLVTSKDNIIYFIDCKSDSLIREIPFEDKIQDITLQGSEMLVISESGSVFRLKWDYGA